MGMPPSLSATIGADLVSSFLDRFPQVRLHLIDGFSGYVNEWLAAGRLDMAIINNARKSPYVRMDPLLFVDLFLVGRRDMIDVREDDGETMPTRLLADLPLLLVGQHHGLRRALESAAQKLSIDLAIRAEVDSLNALRSLVRNGYGITVLPHGAISEELSDPNLIVRRLVEPDLFQQFMLAYSLQRPTTLAMRELARSIRQKIRQGVENGTIVGRL